MPCRQTHSFFFTRIEPAARRLNPFYARLRGEWGGAESGEQFAQDKQMADEEAAQLRVATDEEVAIRIRAHDMVSRTLQRSSQR